MASRRGTRLDSGSGLIAQRVDGVEEENTAGCGSRDNLVTSIPRWIECVEAATVGDGAAMGLYRLYRLYAAAALHPNSGICISLLHQLANCLFTLLSFGLGLMLILDC